MLNKRTPITNECYGFTYSIEIQIINNRLIHSTFTG